MNRRTASRVVRRPPPPTTDSSLIPPTPWMHQRCKLETWHFLPFFISSGSAAAAARVSNCSRSKSITEHLRKKLTRDLDDQWHVFNGIQLQEASDIDHVIVGPGGLYCVSTKSARGLFSITPRLSQQQSDGADREHAIAGDGPAGAADGPVGADVPYVNAVLAVPLAYVDFSGPQQNVWVLHQHDLLETIANAPKRLERAEVERVAKALEMLRQSGKTIYKADDRRAGTTDRVSPSA